MKLSSTGLPKPHIRPGKNWPFLCVGAGTYGQGKTMEEAYEAWKSAREINNCRSNPGYIMGAKNRAQEGQNMYWPWSS